MTGTPDFIVVGGGSAGCAAAAGLVELEAGSVALVEAGPRDGGAVIRVPLGVAWLMGSRRDWRLNSAPQKALGGRTISIPRGRLLGGSGSINSMVWFRGRRDDFDRWEINGWRWSDVEADFEAVEARMTPARLADPHPLSEALQRLFGGNGMFAPTPEYESAGVFRFNIRDGRRHSAADAFLRPAQAAGLRVVTGRQVSRLGFRDGRARSVIFADGSEMIADKGIILSAGSIGSPEILLRSGIGPLDDLAQLGIDIVQRSDEIGANLHDHPAAGVHHVGRASGYGVTLGQLPTWLMAPFRYLANGKGPLGSPTAEAGAFFNARGDGGPPDIQMHLLPFMMGWGDRMIVPGSGYFADVCVCRPRSRGRLSLRHAGTEIDLGLFSDPADLDLLIAGWKRLRELLAETPLGSHRAPEMFPGRAVANDEEIRAHVLAHAATTFHPVGTLRMGDGDAPVTPRLRVRGVDGLWVADASIMPAITSANTNAPSIMIGHRAARMIAADAA